MKTYIIRRNKEVLNKYDKKYLNMNLPENIKKLLKETIDIRDAFMNFSIKSLTNKSEKLFVSINKFKKIILFDNDFDKLKRQDFITPLHTNYLLLTSEEFLELLIKINTPKIYFFHFMDLLGFDVMKEQDYYLFYNKKKFFIKVKKRIERVTLFYVRI